MIGHVSERLARILSPNTFSVGRRTDRPAPEGVWTRGGVVLLRTARTKRKVFGSAFVNLARKRTLKTLL